MCQPSASNALVRRFTLEPDPLVLTVPMILSTCVISLVRLIACYTGDKTTVNREIFELKNSIRKIFVLFFCSYDGLRKYFNAIFLTHGRRETSLQHSSIKKYWRHAAAGEVPVCERETHNGALDRNHCLPMPFSLVTFSTSFFARANCLCGQTGRQRPLGIGQTILRLKRLRNRHRDTALALHVHCHVLFSDCKFSLL